MNVPDATAALDLHGGQIQGQRARQEDAFAIERFEPGSALAAAADGLGGHPAGDIASREGLQAFVRAFGRSRRDSQRSPQDWLEQAIHSAQRHLLKQQRNDSERFGMATTLVGLYLDDRALWGVSVGDSYLLRLRGGELTRLNELHGDGSGVTSAIGFNLTQIDLTGPLITEPGDRYLLATDGIVTLPQAELTHLLATADAAEGAVHDLLAAVEQQAHPYQDNVTLVAVFA